MFSSPHIDLYYTGVKRFTTEQQQRVKKVIQVLKSAIPHFIGREYSAVSSAWLSTVLSDHIC